MTVKALRKTSKAEALAQLAERPDMAANVSAAARLWGVSRSTVRVWVADYAAMAASSPDPATAMAEPPPVPPSPVAVAMVKPLHDEPFQAEPLLRDERPRQEAPVAATKTDERPPVEATPADMAAPVATPSTAMAATEAAPIAEKPAGIPARLIERPTWRIVWWRIVWRSTELPAVPAPPARRSLALILVAVVLFLGALVLVGAGLFMSACYASSFGSGVCATVAIGTVQAAVAVAIDSIALVLLSAGCMLWSRGRWLLALVAWVSWPVMVCLSLLATTGFSATNISDALAKRSAAVAETSNATIKVSNAASDLKKLRDERDAIAERRTVQAIKLQLVGDRRKVDLIDRDAFDATAGCIRLTTPDSSNKACAPLLPTLKALVAAQRRDELDRKISEAENKQGNAPAKPEGAPAAEGNQESATPITSADPLAEQVPRIVKWVTRGTITPSSDDVVMLRILWLTVPPVLAGVFLMLATALWAPPRTKP